MKALSLALMVVVTGCSIAKPMSSAERYDAIEQCKASGGTPVYRSYFDGGIDSVRCVR